MQTDKHFLYLSPEILTNSPQADYIVLQYKQQWGALS